MNLFLLLFSFPAVFAVNRIKDLDFKAINFAKKINGKRLNGSVFEEISVDSEISCQIACVKDMCCLSYNFGATKDEGKFICQHSDSDRFTSRENFIEDSEVLYRGIQVTLFEKSEIT